MAASTCPGCGQGLDPLRAGHVAILDGQFLYFCGPDCKQAYLKRQGRPPEEEVSTAAPPGVAFGPPPSLRPPTSTSTSTSTSTPTPTPSAPARVLATLDVLGLGFGMLAPAIGLLGDVADVARPPLVVAAWAMLALRVVRQPRDPADPHALVVLAPAAGAVVAACWAPIVDDPRAVSIAVLAGVACAVAIAVEVLVARARHRIDAARQRVVQALDVGVRVIHGDDAVAMSAADVRPGEQFVVEAGEVVGADGTVVAGEARVAPWLDASVEVLRREGDPVVAGARVVASRLRLTTTFSGPDRAWVKMLSLAPSRIDVAAPTARALRLTIERGAPVAGLLAGVGAFLGNATPVETLAATAAGAMAFGAKTLSSLVACHFARAHLEALRSGIAYKDPRAFERAASANVAVLSARGTVLMGEPDIVAIEPIGAGADEVDRVLSLAAGAETASTHPFAAAILRAARTRGVRPDHVRNATAHASLGVTAFASSGERLVVGGRAIMLEEKIGVAVADARTTELEAQGRSVLLVALGDRLVGLIALQDGLRPGARAAVQMLLDARIEPVLLSGEARDTCETIGRALDIDHVRPEVPDADRGPEVRALGEGGHVIAVIGHPSGDDGALGAADVAVAMAAAGSTPGEWAVAIAGDDLRDAARALAIPHATRARVRVAIALGATPGLIALLAVGFGIAPLAVAPLATMLGAAAVAAHARDAAGRG